MSCQVINNKTIMCSSNHQFKKGETLIMLNEMIYIYICMKINNIYVTNHTYVQFKVAKKRLSGLLMLLMLLLFFLFSFLRWGQFLDYNNFAILWASE